MANELSKTKNRSTKARYYSQDKRDTANTGVLQKAINQVIFSVTDGEPDKKIDLSNPEEVKRTAVDYMQACSLSGTIPTMTGFAAAAGYSRQGLYNYLQRNDTRSAQLIKRLRTSWTNILMQSGLAGITRDSVTIFLMKNTGEGLSDRMDFTFDQKPVEKYASGDPEEIARKYLAGMATPTEESEDEQI